MIKQFRLDGADYDVGAMSTQGKRLIESLTFAQLQIRALTNQKALLTKARNAYIAELKLEMVKGRTGVNLGALFSDD